MIESRILRALSAMVRELVAPTAYHALVRYRVVSSVFGRLVLQAVKRGGPWPDMLPISMQPGAPGLDATLAPGGVVLVSFIEGDASLPIVTHFAAPGEGGWRPVSLTLDASDEVKIGESATTVSLASGSALVPTPAQAIGRPIRYGDPVIFLPPGNGVLLPPAGPQLVAKVKAS